MMKYPKFLIGIFLLYLIFVFPLMGRPLVVDEIAFAEAVKIPWSFASLGPGGHPPLYVDILRICSQFFGIHDQSLRLVGVVCFLLNLVLIYQLSRQLFKDKRVGLLAGLIFTLYPMAIQGSLILDIDNTVLTVLLLATIYYFFRNKENISLRSGIFLTLLIFLSFWAKVTTPFILIGSLILFYLLKGDIRKALQIFIIGLSGFMFFLIVWSINSWLFNFSVSSASHRLFSVIARGLKGTSISIIPELFLRTLRVALWLGIFHLLLFAAIFYQLAKKVFKKDNLISSDFLVVYAFSIFSGYLLIGGVIFSFARYHYPMLPIISILIASIITERQWENFKKQFLLYLLSALFITIFSGVILKDPLFQINYTLRKLTIFSPQESSRFLGTFVLGLSLCCGSVFLFTAIIQRRTKALIYKENFYVLSICLILLMGICTNYYSRWTGFFTTYCYGRDIKNFLAVSALCKELSAKQVDSKIIAPEDILYHAGIKVACGYDTLWNDPERFLRLIREEETAAVIYGFTYNAVYSYRNIFSDPLVLAQLRSNFVIRHVGEYTVWIRK